MNPTIEDLDANTRMHELIGKVFAGEDGVEVLEWLLDIGLWLHVPENDFAAGKQAIANKVFATMICANPDVCHQVIDRLNVQYQKKRSRARQDAIEDNERKQREDFNDDY